MMTDPIADMLTRVRNAMKAGHAEVVIPFSIIKNDIVNKMAEAGYIEGSETVGEGARKQIVVKLRYAEGKKAVIRGLERVSKPGRRVYVHAVDIKPLRRGMGMSILSTPKGVLADVEAKKQGVGGEVLCSVW